MYRTPAVSRRRTCKAVESEVIFSQFAGGAFSWLERLPVTQEIAGSSPVAHSMLPDVAPKSSTHNPTHTYLRSPRERRGDSWRGEIFYSCRRNHLEPKRITERATRRRLSC